MNPHPGPLPVLGEGAIVSAADQSGFSQWSIHNTHFMRKTSVFPSPDGEGQGEETSNKIIYRAKVLVQKTEFITTNEPTR